MTILTWDAVNKGTGAVLSNSNLTAMIPNASSTVRATEGKSSGKWYWEVSFTSLANAVVGIVNNLAGVGSTYNNANARCYYSANGNKFPENSTYGTTYVVGDTIGVALDIDNGTLTFYKNGMSQGVSHTNIISMGEIFPAVTSASSTTGNTNTVNFGATPFKHPIPNGYKPYNFEFLNKILLLQENSEVNIIDKIDSAMVKIPNQSEQSFINYGMSQGDLSEIDFYSDFTKKNYIQNESSPLGEGKVFEQALDVKKIVKNVSIK